MKIQGTSYLILVELALLFSCGVYSIVASIGGTQPPTNSVYDKSVSITPTLSLMFHSHAVFVIILFILNKLLLCS